AFSMRCERGQHLPGPEEQPQTEENNKHQDKSPVDNPKFPLFNASGDCSYLAWPGRTTKILKLASSTKKADAGPTAHEVEQKATPTADSVKTKSHFLHGAPPN